MTFFPQEDCQKLLTLRSHLTPFLETAMEALELALELEWKGGESKTLLEKLIQNAPAENSTSNLFTHWSQAFDDLEFEFDAMLNLE